MRWIGAIRDTITVIRLGGSAFEDDETLQVLLVGVSLIECVDIYSINRSWPRRGDHQHDAIRGHPTAIQPRAIASPPPRR